MIIWCALCREGISPLFVRFIWCQQRRPWVQSLPLTAICCLEICYPSTHPPPSLIIGYSLTSTQNVQTNAICVAMKMFQSFICCKPKCNILKSQSVNCSSFFPDCHNQLAIASLVVPASRPWPVPRIRPSSFTSSFHLSLQGSFLWIHIVKNNAGYNCKLNVILSISHSFFLYNILQRPLSMPKACS